MNPPQAATTCGVIQGVTSRDKGKNLGSQEV
jgi:hypothetical protein